MYPPPDVVAVDGRPEALVVAQQHWRAPCWSVATLSSAMLLASRDLGAAQMMIGRASWSHAAGLATR